MMSTRPDSKRLIEFHEFLLKFQAVERFTINPYDSSRRENDVEHSYYLAMAAWMLAPHFELDRDKCIRIALAHDMVEVHAGDTSVFGPQDHIDTKGDREYKALERLRSDWPDFAEMIAEIEDYKAKTSNEAKFVYALDKIMPIIVNMLNDGHGWRRNEVTLEQVIAEKNQKIPKGSPLYDYYQELLAMLQDSREYFFEGGEKRQKH
jgi:putative hydrolase of HD superfamily